MLLIPDGILNPFNEILKEKGIPAADLADYRKWLMYYLDFRVKYSPPDVRSEQVRLFIEKRRSRNQSQQKLEQAAAALSCYFASQPRRKQDVSLVVDTKGVLLSPVPQQRSLKSTSMPISSAPRAVSSLKGAMGGGQEPSQRGGKQYNEWRCLERTGSPEWDAVIDRCMTKT